MRATPCRAALESLVELFKILVVCLLIGIVLSLGSALFHLVNDKGDSKRMVRALTVRVGLSIALFLLLMGAWALGYISPHGIQP